MSYRVLARTYRSNTFDEIVGQEAVTTTLRNAITSGRVHHGYLFTGTRGVGKTSMARILAKSLNCLQSEEATVTPCCECNSCKAIAVGEDVDVVEIDAASNTGVDNIRELRSNANLRPARARFKIYVIDEVHMLSTQAFNALLKTLEEPPSHVKFILATTESQKVPATIQSRCQRFDFRAIDVETIAAHLGRILEAEGIESEEAVLRRIARLGNGSMRDALSLLDKVLSYQPDRLTASVVDEIIPPPHDELAFAVMDCVSKGDAAGALRELDSALQSGRTVDRFCDHLIEHNRTLMLMRVCGESTDLVDVSGTLRPTLFAQAERFDAPTYVYLIALLEELRRNVKFSGAARSLADAAVVRMSMASQFTDIGKLLERLEGGSAALQKSAGDSKKKVSGSNSSGVTRAASTSLPSSATGSKDTPSTPAPLERASSEHGAPEPVSPRKGSTRHGSAPQARTLSSADRELVAKDELVQRVKNAVDGKLVSVLTAAGHQQGTLIGAESEDLSDNGTTG